MDNQIKIVDGVGDEVGINNAGEVVGEKQEVPSKRENIYECNICGKLSKTNIEKKSHLINTHSEYAISLTTEFNTKKFQKPGQLHKCVNCDRNFFFYQTWEEHVKDCHVDMGIIGGGEEKEVNLNISSECEEGDTESDDSTMIDKTNDTVLTVKNQLFIEKQWGIDENSNPAGVILSQRN